MDYTAIVSDVIKEFLKLCATPNRSNLDLEIALIAKSMEAKYSPEILGEATDMNPLASQKITVEVNEYHLEVSINPAMTKSMVNVFKKEVANMVVFYS